MVWHGSEHRYDNTCRHPEAQPVHIPGALVDGRDGFRGSRSIRRQRSRRTWCARLRAGSYGWRAVGCNVLRLKTFTGHAV